MKQGRLLGDTCLVSKSGLELWATPTINCLQWWSSSLQVPAFMSGDILDALLSLVAYWIYMLALFGLLSLDYSSFGQFAGFTVLMECNKVRLENKICHVILLWNLNWRYIMHSLSETILAEYVKWKSYKKWNKYNYMINFYVIMQKLWVLGVLCMDRNHIIQLIYNYLHKNLSSC